MSATLELPVLAGVDPAGLVVLTSPDEINLDYAATAPCLRVAAEAVVQWLPSYASVHRGAGAASRRCTEAYEQARQRIARFLGCRPDDQVVFTRHTTDAMNLLARALPPGTQVVTFASEHHANLLPWRQPVRLPVPASPAAAIEAVDTALRRLRRAGHTAEVLVAVTGASNVTGERWPVAGFSAVARRHDARVAVDAAQLAPHAPVDLAALDVDYLALSGHKLYAPFGVGVLAGRPDWLDAAPPYLAGGGAALQVGAEQVRYATGPARHEAGTPNLLGVLALAAVCDALRSADRAAIGAREQALLERLRTGLAALPGVAELRMFSPGVPRVGLVSFAVAGHDSAAVSAHLARRHRIRVRDGRFCAHLVVEWLLAEAAERTGRRLPTTAVRASIGLGTTEEHVDRLVAGVSELAS